MKKILLLAGLALSLGMSYKTNAQVRVNFNVGVPVAQQSWHSYDDDYYYMPEQNVYYNKRRGAYVYQEQGAWLTANRLPSRYGNYSYQNSRYERVNGCEPYARNNEYRQSYYRDNNRYDNRYERRNDNRNDRYSSNYRNNRDYRR